MINLSTRILYYRLLCKTNINRLFFASFIIICWIPSSIRAQQTEFRASLNSGFFSYRGNGAESVSRINNTAYANNPYGSKGGLCYGLSLNLRRVAKSNFLFGADLSYEMLRSRIDLKYSDIIGDIASQFEGKTYLNTSFINLFPYIGRRVKVVGQPFDLIGGLDVAYILSAREKGSAMSIDNSQLHIETSIDRKHIKTDIRPRVQLSTDLNKIGFYVGYSYGLRNYQVRLIGGSTEAYSRMWRLGVTYRLN